MRTIRALLKNDSGATAIEYALLVAMVALAITGALGGLGENVGGLVTRVGNLLAGT